MTPLQREALQMCLEYIETDAHERRHVRWKIQEALAEPATEEFSAVQPAAQPQQEPVAWRVKWPAIGGGHKWLMVDRPLMEKEGFVNEALYTSPPAQEFVCSTGLCHYKPAAPVQPVASLKEADVLMIAEAHGIDPSTKGLYGFYIDCISSQPPAQPAPVQEQQPYAYANPDELSADSAFRWCEINEYTMPVYTTPPAAQRPWVGLTDEKLRKLCDEFWLYPRKLLQAIEAELKEKNTAQPAVPMTNDEVDRAIDQINQNAINWTQELFKFARAIEAAHGIKENA